MVELTLVLIISRNPGWEYLHVYRLEPSSEARIYMYTARTVHNVKQRHCTLNQWYSTWKLSRLFLGVLFQIWSWMSTWTLFGKDLVRIWLYILFIYIWSMKIERDISIGRIRLDVSVTEHPRISSKSHNKQVIPGMSEWEFNILVIDLLISPRVYDAKLF